MKVGSNMKAANTGSEACLTGRDFGDAHRYLNSPRDSEKEKRRRMSPAESAIII